MSAGIDTHWARRKLDRARVHLAELQRVSGAWLEPTTYPLDVVLADDGRRLELVLAFAEPPPLEEWALVVGDCIHNIRTALDVFIWANSEMLSENERERVAYPILQRDDDPDADPDADLLEDLPSDRRRWVKQNLAGLPRPLRSQVLKNIRWASLPVGDHFVRHQRLPLIAELDKIDKHRLALDLVASTSIATWNVRAWGPGGEEVPVDLDYSGPDLGTATIRNGRVVMGTGTPSGPIARTQGDAWVTLNLRVRVPVPTTKDPTSMNVLAWLGHFIEDVDGLLDVLGAPGP